MKRGFVSRRVPERESKLFFNKRLIFLLVIVLASAILIFLFNSSPPQILSASAYPEKVMPGQLMLIRAEVKDNLAIKNVKASIETDDLPDKTRLLLVDGSIRQGIYERGWIVHDTSAQKWYNITITATNLFGRTATKIIPYQDPTQSHNASEIVGGTFTGNYTFAGGNINIGESVNITKNLTIGDTVVINSTILLYPESSPANQTGYGKIYYRASETVIDSYTKLLLHADGTNGSTTFTDSSSGGKSVTANGQAHTDTQYQKFGTASGRFDGTGDYLSIPDHDDFNLGQGAFTVDFWIRFNSLPLASQEIFESNAAGLQILFEWQANDANGNGEWRFAGNFDLRGRDYSLLINTWYHVALVRNGITSNDWFFFRDGTTLNKTLYSGSYDITLPDVAATFFIGKLTSDIRFFNGSLDEFRISKGIARWTANFSVPTSAYADVAGGLYFQYQNGTEKLIAGE